MRFIILTIFTLSILVTGCDSTKKGVTSSNGQKCTPLKKVKINAFNNLYSENYELAGLRQDGNNLEFDIITNADLSGAALYWTGAVRKSYPPQAAVKLVLLGVENGVKTDEKSQQSFCFDISQMDNYGDRIKIYIMDDEEAIDFKFGE